MDPTLRTTDWLAQAMESINSDAMEAFQIPTKLLLNKAITVLSAKLTSA